jgi:hypothetical protein
MKVWPVHGDAYVYMGLLLWSAKAQLNAQWAMQWVNGQLVMHAGCHCDSLLDACPAR